MNALLQRSWSPYLVGAGIGRFELVLLCYGEKATRHHDAIRKHRRQARPIGAPNFGRECLPGQERRSATSGLGVGVGCRCAARQRDQHARFRRLGPGQRTSHLHPSGSFQNR